MKTEVETEVIVEEDVDISELTDVLDIRFLVLHNDDHNSFDHVINCLIDICDHEFPQAEQCAHIVHNNGQCTVKEGLYDDLEPLKDALIERGLSVTIK